MSSHRNFNWIEWGFVAFLAVACAILTALQYRWTGEIAQAEAGRLRANLEEQSQLLCRAFDAELSSYCRQFFVTRSEVEDLGRDAACLQRLREWLAGHPRPIFRHIAIAIHNDEQLQLQAMDLSTQTLAPMKWPEHWTALKDSLETRCRKGSGGSGGSGISGSSGGSGSSSGRSYSSFSSFSTYSDPGGALFDFVQPTPRDYDGQWEGAWIIFELDMDYVRKTWLPELINTYLSPADRPPNEIVVKSAGEPSTTIFASEAAATTDDGQTPFSTRFNKQTRSFGYSRPLTGEGRWILETRHRPGALEAAVAGSRRRNLGVALGVNTLILVVGVALVRHTRRSRSLAEAQMNFVANVSHELRTPLTVIQGAAHNLQHGVVTEPGRISQYATLIQSHAENLGAMVEQILALAAARGRKAALREAVSIQEVLKSSIAACEQEIKAAGCEVAMQLPDRLPEVHGDAEALRRVFHNLISNAAKHAAPGRWIGISAAEAKGAEPPAVVVKVSDRGPGIPKAEQDAVFEPFVRGSAAREAQTRGSGLGLSLVREILKLHGGTVSLASEPGMGAIFSVKIPSA